MWTKAEFRKQLRLAGWKRPKNAQGLYEHPAGGKFYFWQWHKGIAAHFETGELWRLFAEIEALPHPAECGIVPKIDK